MRSGLLEVLNCYDGYNVQFSYRQLFELFGMCNRLFGKISNSNLKAISGIEEKEDKYFNFLTTEFYSTVTSEFKKILNRTLTSLKNQKILMFMPGYNIIENKDTIVNEDGEKVDDGNPVEVRCASKEEISYIIGVEGRVLAELNLKDSIDLYMSHKQEIYYKRIKDILEEEMGWLGVYPIIDVVFNPEMVKLNRDMIPLKYKMNEISMEKARSVMQHKVQRNNSKVDSIMENGGIVSGKELFYYDDRYLTDVDKLIDILIKLPPREGEDKIKDGGVDANVTKEQTNKQDIKTK